MILTTHSQEFLDACSDLAPTTTVAKVVDGATQLSVIEGAELARWLKEYRLGALARSGELEALA
ncbi:MAG: hypothetical protein FJ029_08655 [Actinobacteria bacterium]|nr:hypothetical protein [Actinomycetota bacterium]